MSLDSLEKALWDLNVDRSAKERFRQDPLAFCSRYRVSSAEAQMVAEFDIAGLLGLGVNPMLTMGYWLELEGSRSLRGYVARARSSTPVPGGSAP